MIKIYNSFIATFLLLLFYTSTIQAQKIEHVLDEALVQLEVGADLKAFQNDFQTFKGVETKFRIKRHISKKMNVYQVYFDHTLVNEYDFRKHLLTHTAVKIVQVNHILTNRETVPDDPEFATQWHWVNTGQSGGTADADIDMDLAWDITTGGTTANGDEIVVAVYDDGGDLDHPDLIANNWINLHEIAGNGIDDDNNGYVDDVNGWNFGGGNNNVDGGAHGVNVAGMIGGVGNNATMGTGVNWNVKIMNNRRAGISEAQVIEFYSYALDQRERYNDSNGAEGAFVVATNSSWGIDQGDPDSAPIWCAFYDSLGVVGILSCGATTNSNLNVDVVGDLPTACPSEYMVAVTATDHSDDRNFSGYGATTIDVGAPGEDIYTTDNNGNYEITSGTSFASPTTAGVIALLYAAPCPNIANLALSDPALAAQNVRDYLFDGTELVGNLEGDVVHGRVNAFNSLQLIMDNCGPCPPPSGLTATDLIDVEGNLVWNNPPDGQSNTLQYRATGSTDWIEVPNATSPYFLSGLTACTEYEFQVEATCTDTVSGFSNSYIFTTDGCCVAPEDLTVSNINQDSGIASWSSVFAAQSYNVRISVLGSGTWTDFNTTNTVYTFNNLVPCTSYEIQVQTVCAAETTPFTDSYIFTTFGCGACTDLTYCESAGEAFGEEWITHFEINTLINDTPDAPSEGNSDFTSSMFTTTLQTYATYTASMTPAYSGNDFPEHFRIFIDYNQDGTFDEATELAFDAGGTVTENLMGDVTIPGDAALGLTRLRVVMRWNEPNGPCGTYNFGETEDYCVTIEEGVPVCEIPEALTASGITQVAATLNWAAVGLADSYLVNYRALGAATWIQDNSNTTFLTVGDLSDCTEYEFRVASVCPDNVQSDFSATSQFFTICACPTPINLDSTNITVNSATLSWSDSDNSDSYELRYKLASAATWVDQPVAITSITLNNLVDCSDYEYQVRSICSNNESGWSDSFTFHTDCFVSVSEIENGIDNLELMPNPFDDKLSIRFDLSENLSFHIKVFNATGQLISMDEYNPGSGMHSYPVNGLDAVGSGVYFIAITTDKGTKVRRAVKQ